MAAVLTGTPVEITWAAGIDPAGQSVTIPADATAVYFFWSYFNSTSGNGLASATLGGNAPAQTFEVVGLPAAGDEPSVGVAVWYNPPTGSQTLDPAWDAAPSEGPVSAVVFVKDGDTTAWRDADGLNGDGATALSVTLTTVAGDLVLKFDQRSDATPPSNTSGWTSHLTGDNNIQSFRLASISAAGVTQACPAEDEAWSSIIAVSIPAAAGGGGGSVMPLMMAHHE